MHGMEVVEVGRGGIATIEFVPRVVVGLQRGAGPGPAPEVSAFRLSGLELRVKILSVCNVSIGLIRSTLRFASVGSFSDPGTGKRMKFVAQIRSQQP